MYECIYVRMHVRIYEYMCVCVCMYIYICMWVCILDFLLWSPCTCGLCESSSSSIAEYLNTRATQHNSRRLSELPESCLLAPIQA